MNILVIENNIVMTSVISDVLTVDGFSVVTAASAKEAKIQFDRESPNIVVFDVDTDSLNTLDFISTIKPVDTLRLIAICTSIDKSPKHPSISTTVLKPFKGSEILMAVRKAKSEIESKTGKKKMFSVLTGLFSKKKAKEVKEKKEEPLPMGKSYLVLEDEPDKIYEVAKKYSSASNKLFILTKSTIKTTKSRITGVDVTVVGITKRAREGYISYSKIGSIMGTLGEFTNDNLNCTVIIEGIEEMVDEHGMNTVITMLCQLLDKGVANGTTFLISARPDTFSENEINLLSSHLEIYSEEEQEKEGSA